ncbi:MAG TPA: hypothetical protein VK463_17810, partial [Desulfomonilaceae bacterium]|nr:hypothetical protein [Desulfomonilaceae bacterium]
MQIREFIIPENVNPDRADRILAAHLPGEYSRSALARLMRKGLVTLRDRSVRPSTILSPGDKVELLPEDRGTGRARMEPEVPDFIVVMEDHDLIVVDKPAG